MYHVVMSKLPRTASKTGGAAFSNSDFTFYTKAAYYQDLAKRIAGTTKGDRVMLMSMSIGVNARGVRPVLEQLNQAARRGVHVTLALDAYSFIVSEHLSPGPLLVSRRLSPRWTAFFRNNLLALEELERNGGRFSIINRPSRPFRSPFKGRCHIKHSIVNDYVYTGGCNLNRNDNIDIMVGWKSGRAADWLYDITNQIIESGFTGAALRNQDIALSLGDNTELLLDAGKAGQSMIFDRAMKLIDEADSSIFMTCQFFPNSTTVEHLVAAHRRGVSVSLYYNHPSKHDLLRRPLHSAVLTRERLRTPVTFRQHQLPKTMPFIHAKVLATDKGAIIGSHNFVRVGVDFGTAEIALTKHDADFARQTIEAITSQLG
jgi:phosphatidylserine/phosphatidylglycerophosphate/cardiolipin synthase-like enzyme